jgi:hypothetical protein
VEKVAVIKDTYSFTYSVSTKTSLKNVPSVCYWCETWSLTLREEHRLRVFESRVLGRIFRPKRREII